MLTMDEFYNTIDEFYTPIEEFSVAVDAIIKAGFCSLDDQERILALSRQLDPMEFESDPAHYDEYCQLNNVDEPDGWDREEYLAKRTKVFEREMRKHIQRIHTQSNLMNFVQYEYCVEFDVSMETRFRGKTYLSAELSAYIWCLHHDGTLSRYLTNAMHNV